jgi:hypothetical protein
MRAYTWFILVGLAGVSLTCFILGDHYAGFALLGIFGFFLLLGLFSVRGYIIDGDQLVIEHPGWNTYVDLSLLSEAKPVPNIIHRTFSLWSTRGLFGFIGYGYNTGIGSYQGYVTDSAKAVMLRFESGKVLVVSPDSPTEFVSTILNRRKGLASEGVQYLFE